MNVFDLTAGIKVDLVSFRNDLSKALLMAEKFKGNQQMSFNVNFDIDTDDFEDGLKSVVDQAKSASDQAYVDGDATLDISDFESGIDDIISQAEDAEDDASVKSYADIDISDHGTGIDSIIASANLADTEASVDANADIDVSGFNSEIDSAIANADQLDQSVSNVDESASGASASLGQIATQANFEGVIGGLQSVSTKLVNIISYASRAVKGLAELAIDSSTWADDLITESQKYEIEVETLQRMRYASKFIDTDVNTMESAFARLQRNMGAFQEGNEEAVKSFNKIGVTAVDNTGSLRPTIDVFMDVVDTLYAMKQAGKITRNEMDNLADDLFGRNVADLGPIFESGAAAYRDLMDEAPVVSEEQVNALGQVNDAYQELTSQFETTKMELLAELAPAITEAITALSEFIKQFREFLESDEGKSTVQDTLTHLSEALTAIVSSITGEGNIQTVFDTLTGTIQKLSDAFKWISDNSGSIVTAFEAIGIAVGAIKVGEGVLTFVKFLKGASGLFGGGAANAAASGVGQVAKSAGAGLGIKKGLQSLGMSGMSLLKGLGATVAPLLGPGLFGIGVGSIVGKGIDEKYVRDVWGEFNEVQAHISDYVKNASSGQVGNTLAAFSKVMNGDTVSSVEGIKQLFAQHANEIYEALPELDFWDAIGDKVDFSDGISSEEAQRIIESDINAFDWLDLGKDVVVKLTEGMSQGDNLKGEIESGIDEGSANGANDLEKNADAAADRSAGYMHDTYQNALNSLEFPVFRYGNNLLGNVGNTTMRLHASGMSQGEILRGLTPFGVDGSGIVHYGGESGLEAVVGVNSLNDMIRQSVRGAMGQVVQRLDSLVSGQGKGMQIVLDTGVLVGETVAAYDDAFEGLSNRKRGGRA